MGAERPHRATTVHADRSPLPLPPDELHLWTVDVGAGIPDAPRRHAATTAGERDRAARLRRPGDGDRFLSAHGALRLILAQYLASDPVALPIAADERGKPFIQGVSLQFNLSHSGALALIAVAHGRQVGVDVERLRPIPELEAITARICTPGELSALAALAEPHREGAFFAMWARKEALAKATGEGMRAIARDTTRQAKDRWTLVQVTDLPGYAACVAAEGTGWQLVRRTGPP